MSRGEWVGLLCIVAFPAVVCIGCWLQDRTDVPVTDVRLGGVYRTGNRTVSVLGIRPGEHVVTLVLHDIRTGERAVVTYHDGATFSRTWLRPVGRLR